MRTKIGVLIFFLAFLGMFFLYVGIYSLASKGDITGEAVTGEIVTGEATSADLDLNVTVGNSAPVLNVDTNILVCEQGSLNKGINATDRDGDNLTLYMSPVGTFFLEQGTQTIVSGNTIVLGTIYSGNLDKSDLGVTQENVSVADTHGSPDNKYVNITVIEINNKPSLRIGNQVAVVGTLFNLQANVSDVENGNQDSGNFSFNISFSSGNLFNISANGTMSFTPTSSQIGNYTVSVCVTDRALSSISQNISFCWPDVGTNVSNCSSFILAVSAVPAYCGDRFCSNGETCSSCPGDCGVCGGGSSGGGGGGGQEILCNEKWGCLDWIECKKLEDSLKNGEISGENYRVIKEKCEENTWSDKICGFQTRTCTDLNNCGKNKSIPAEMQECYFTFNPSCSDRIKNCHDGQCEFLVDCGGPCSPCPSCSDGIKNQGENDVDCGGPCVKKCLPLASPKLRSQIEIKDYALVLFIVGAVVIAFAFYGFLARKQKPIPVPETAFVQKKI